MRALVVVFLPLIAIAALILDELRTSSRHGHQH
jgi:hypothetical protein